MNNLQKSIALAELNPLWFVQPDGTVLHHETGSYLFSLTETENFFTEDVNGNPHLAPWAWAMINVFVAHLTFASDEFSFLERNAIKLPLYQVQTGLLNEMWRLINLSDIEHQPDKEDLL